MGDFVVVNLPPGNYNIVAEASGFKKSQALAVRLDVEGTLRQDFRLQVGTVTEQVTQWRKRDGCSPVFTTQTNGTFRLQTWSHCSAKSVVALGTYEGGGHAWPAGGAGLPSGADVLWRFLMAPRSTTPLPPSQAPPTTARLPT